MKGTVKEVVEEVRKAFIKHECTNEEVLSVLKMLEHQLIESSRQALGL